MIDHLSIGVRDLAASKRFYDSVLAALGYTCLHEGSDMLGYGRDAVVLWICAVRRPVPADEESGLHICFAAPTRGSVDVFHAAAIRQGGRDNGRPGVRQDYSENYYAAFAVDPEAIALRPIAAASRADGAEAYPRRKPGDKDQHPLPK